VEIAAVTLTLMAGAGSRCGHDGCDVRRDRKGLLAAWPPDLVSVLVKMRAPRASGGGSWKARVCDPCRNLGMSAPTGDAGSADIIGADGAGAFALLRPA
jgi:hypothetical protein